MKRASNIICFRLLGSPVSPDCATDVTPVTRVTTAYIATPGQETGTGTRDTLATVIGIMLIMSIMVYTTYMSYTHRELLIKFKTELVAQLLQVQSHNR